MRITNTSTARINVLFDRNDASVAAVEDVRHHSLRERLYAKRGLGGLAVPSGAIKRHMLPQFPGARLSQPCSMRWLSSRSQRRCPSLASADIG